MSSLVYLVHTGIRNSLKELLHKPGKLVLYLIVILAIVGTAVGSFFIPKADATLPPGMLRGVFFAFLTLFVAIAVQKGTNAGDEIFEMNDVNLLFVSPLNPRSILLYGLLKLIKVSFFAGFFILFQSTNLSHFGVRFGGLLILFAMNMLNTVVLTLVSLVIYSTTNGNPRRQLAVKLCAAAMFVPLLVSFAAKALASGDVLSALLASLDSPLLSAIPFAGWTAAGAVAFIEGKALAGLFWLGLLMLTGTGLLVFIMRSRADYYEDVLVATETAFEKKRAAAQGDMQAAGVTGKRIRVTKTGVAGAGASAIFYKHLRETFRQNRFGFFGMYTIIMFLSMLAAAVFMREFMNTVIILQVLMWTQIFMIGTGRGLKEMYSHYLYMIPESSFKKAIWSNMELVLRTLIESVLFIGIPGIILLDNPLVIIMSMLVYTLFSLYLLGVNYLSLRFTGANISAGILMLIYLLVVIIGILPGLVPAMMVGFSMGGLWGALLGLLILGAWELIASLICFALSKDVLHNCDMPVMNQFGK